MGGKRPNLYPVNIAFRLSEASGALLQKLADADPDGASRHECARTIVLSKIGIAAGAAPPGRRRAVANGEALAALLVEARRTGTNVNQIARALNSREPFDAAMQDLLKQAADDIREIAETVRAMVSKRKSP